MAKKIVSVPLHKKKQSPIKHKPKIKKLKAAFKRILNYIKSDNYHMFSALVDPHSPVSPSRPVSFGGFSLQPVKKKEKKLLEEVQEYLRCDCYMYAPLLSPKDSGANSPKGIHSPEKDRVSHYVQVERRIEETTGHGGSTLDSSQEVDHEASYVPARLIAVKHIRVEKETVKHVVHQNCLSS